MNNPYFYYNPQYPMMSYSRRIAEPREEALQYPDFLTPGTTAPSFALEGIVNGQPREVSLSDYMGKWVVLFFYSSDFGFV